MSLIKTRPGSVTDNLARLEVGQSYSMARLVECSGGTAIPDQMILAREKLSSHISRTMFKIRQAHSERDYEIESGPMFGSRSNLYAVAIITRVADKDEA